jgi:hypothetical protein
MPRFPPSLLLFFRDPQIPVRSSTYYSPHTTHNTQNPHLATAPLQKGDCGNGTGNHLVTDVESTRKVEENILEAGRVTHLRKS